MKEITIEAIDSNLPNVLDFIAPDLEEMDCPMKVQMQVNVAVEEIFVNVARYAYTPNQGLVTIQVEKAEDNSWISFTFRDQGIPFDPVAKVDPDLTLPLEERPIGGLGIYMVKKSMDDLHYVYENGYNVFTMKKNIA
ncbi:MAG: ATP-binding protein [Lachnospiraceae bacterium]|nr:ATP-binding protein [Lachnospiraceae bacterium]